MWGLESNLQLSRPHPKSIFYSLRMGGEDPLAGPIISLIYCKDIIE
jgi:hypothetical protein